MKITVVTVAYNSMATIADTVRSVQMQTYPDIEHLIIDGNSTDKTLDVVAAFHNPKIRIISEPDFGIYDAMNKGFSHSTGDVIGFLNADDYFVDINVIERIANEFEDSDVKATFGDLIYVSRDGKKIMRYWKSEKCNSRNLALGWHPPHPTFYVRRTLFERNGNFCLDYKLAADVELMIRYLKDPNIKTSYIPVVLVCMRIGGVTNNSMRNIWKQNREIFDALRRNMIEYSLLKFLLFKIFNRINQRVARLWYSI